MIRLVLVRHGQSLWNLENKFTGWTDVGLSEQGIKEAREAGRTLVKEGYEFDHAFTSYLKRANRTWDLMQEEMGTDVPTDYAWQLNERHYGALQGLNKRETAEKEGEEKVHQWRRSYDVRPPALEEDDVRHPKNNERYGHLNPKDLPATECLKDTVERVIPYYEKEILPMLKDGQRVVIVAHGNSLRALVKYLDGISDDEIAGLNIPTGIPLVYELDRDLKPNRHYYLGDPEVAKAAAQAVANQAK